MFRPFEQILKLYAWEPSFIAKILQFRTRELLCLKKVNVVNAISLVTWILCPFLVSSETS